MLLKLTIFWTLLVLFATIGLYENPYTNIVIVNINILLRRSRQISSLQDMGRWCSPGMSDMTESVRKHYHGLPFINIFIAVACITCLPNRRWTPQPFQIFPVSPAYLFKVYHSDSPAWFSAKDLISNLFSSSNSLDCSTQIFQAGKLLSKSVIRTE